LRRSGLGRGKSDGLRCSKIVAGILNVPVIYVRLRRGTPGTRTSSSQLESAHFARCGEHTLRHEHWRSAAGVLGRELALSAISYTGASPHHKRFSGLTTAFLIFFFRYHKGTSHCDPPWHQPARAWGLRPVPVRPENCICCCARPLPALDLPRLRPRVWAGWMGKDSGRFQRRYAPIMSFQKQGECFFLEFRPSGSPSGHTREADTLFQVVECKQVVFPLRVDEYPE